MKKIIASCIGCIMFVGFSMTAQGATTKCTISSIKGTVVVMECKKDMKLKKGNRVRVKVKKGNSSGEGC